MIIDIIIKNPYSTKKIKEKYPLPYSKLKPDTNSDSPSKKSKGERLISAKQTKNQIKKKKTLNSQKKPTPKIPL